MFYVRTKVRLGNRPPVMIRPALLGIGFMIISAVAFSCAPFLGFPLYFDPTTYKNLTDLKPEILMLYDSFATDSLDTAKVDAIRLKLSQMIEFEKGKGPKNQETAKQIELIKVIFETHVEDRLTTGKWSEIHLENQKENVTEEFDIAISTENLKNRNK